MILSHGHVIVNRVLIIILHKPKTFHLVNMLKITLYEQKKVLYNKEYKI